MVCIHVPYAKACGRPPNNKHTAKIGIREMFLLIESVNLYKKVGKRMWGECIEFIRRRIVGIQVWLLRRL